jgi:hypothetical protein
MGYSNGKITAPVSFTDVQNCLGVSYTDLDKLCKATTINMWAKYKPVAKNLIDTVTGQWDATNNKWLSSATWWKGNGTTDIGGITPKQFNTFSQLLSFYDGNLNGWTYTRPAGGANTPYRLQDFAGYNHNAPKAIENFFMAAEIKQHGQFTASAMMSMPDSNADYITLSDFTSQAFNTLYWGVAFYSGTTFKCKLTADTAGVAQIESTFSGAAVTLPIGTYKVYPFFSNKKIALTDTQETSGTKYYTCPNCTYVTVNIVSDQTGTDATIKAQYMIGRDKIFTMHVNGDSSRGYSNCNAYIIPMTYWSNPSSGISHAAWSSGSFDLGQNEEKSWLAQRLSTAGDYFALLLVNSGQYMVKSAMVTPVAPQTQ